MKEPRRTGAFTAPNPVAAIVAVADQLRGRHCLKRKLWLVEFAKVYRRAAHCGNAAVVAVRQFLRRSALRAAYGGLFLLGRCEGKGAAPCAFFLGPWRGSRVRRCGCE
jgi:hypothetical protein